MTFRISHLNAWEAFDSRGTPTVACRVVVDDGIGGECVVPSGASTGTHEAHELRDGGARYGGKGVRNAVAGIVGDITSALTGHAFDGQADLDRALRELDGTESLTRLGGNAILAVSVAFAIACANRRGVPLHRHVAATDEAPLLPLPMVNIISGGAHAGRAIDIQDLLAVPIGADSFSAAIEWVSRVRAGTAEVMGDHGYATSLIADEGGLSAEFPSNRDALSILVDGIHRAGLRPGDDVGVAVDIAANQLLGADGLYHLASERRSLSTQEWIAEVVEWTEHFPIVSIEDALSEDDYSAWSDLTARLPRLQVLGDDLFVTNVARLRDGIAGGAANAALVKPNQIGTLSDALDVVHEAHANSYRTVLSARSGETEDAWLSELAMGWRTGQIKVGSTMRSERTAKWNRLLKWEAVLGDSVDYAGGALIAQPF